MKEERKKGRKDYMKEGRKEGRTYVPELQDLVVYNGQ